MKKSLFQVKLKLREQQKKDNNNSAGDKTVIKGKHVTSLILQHVHFHISWQIIRPFAQVVPKFN